MKQENPLDPKTIPSNATAKRRASQLSGLQIMFAAILAIGIILAINFSTRIADSRPLQEYYHSVEDEILGLEYDQATLVAERDYAQSDSYVEQWARSEGKMVRPGEVLVIPVPVEVPQEATPAPQIYEEVITSPPEPQNWTLWWKLFFDSEPPDFLN